MQKPKTMRLRWDRIGAVAGVLVLASWCIAAVVPESGSHEEMETEGTETEEEEEEPCATYACSLSGASTSTRRACY